MTHVIGRREGLPVGFGGLEEGKSAHHIGLGEGEGILDGAVHVAFCRKMDDAVHVLLLHETEDTLEVADVHLDKAVVGAVLNVLEVGQVAGVGEFIQIDNLVIRVLVDEQAYYVASDETGAARNNKDPIHKVES